MRARHRRGRGWARRWTGMLESALLLLLHRQPAHGYTLLEQLKEFGLGEVDPSIVYRALRDMEGQGWVTSTWDEEQTQGPPRRVYRLTAAGDEVLSWWVQDLESTLARIERFLQAYRAHMEEGEGEHH